MSRSLDLLALEVCGCRIALRWYYMHGGTMWGVRNMSYPMNWRYPRISLDFGYLSIVIERYWLD